MEFVRVAASMANVIVLPKPKSHATSQANHRNKVINSSNNNKEKKETGVELAHGQDSSI